MTNVQTSRRPSYFGVMLALSLAAVVSAISPAARATGPFSVSRASVSGGASEVIEGVNRRAFGTVFRGGHAMGDQVGRQDALSHISLAPYFNTGPALFMMDARLGRANKGGLTWSFGGVLRTFAEEWNVVTGANIYHSRDNITGTHLRTWGFGVDVLANTWEARANYVRPDGESSALTSQTIDQSSAVFAGNHIVFNRRDTVAEALEKLDVEAGLRLPAGPVLSENVSLKGFVGAYRFQGETISATTGWKTRLLAEVGECLELGVGLNQDTLQDTLVFFNAAVRFGGFKAQDFTKSSAIQRLADPVRRDLTVASLRTDVVVPGVVAINPSDGQPVIVRHVSENDTVGPFLGTVEDPLQSISTALGLPGTDIVLTHAGGLYNAAPDNAVTLGSNMSLFGEGMITTINGDRVTMNTIPLMGIAEELILPSSPTFLADTTLARPTLLGAAGNSVTLAANTRFGGFVVDSAGGAGIVSNNAAGTTIRDVQIQNTAGDGILLTNTTGTTSIIDTVITGAGGPALHVDGGDGSIGLLSNSDSLIPSFSHIENSSQQIILIENLAAGGIVNTTGATLNDTGGRGVEILNSAGNVTIDNAQIVNSTANGIRVLNSTGIYNFRNSIQPNTFITNAAQQSILIEGLGATGQVTFGALQIDDSNGEGIDINSNSGRISFIDSVILGTPNGAGVSVDSSQTGSSVHFYDGLTVSGSGGSGIGLTNNVAGATFTVDGAVGLTGTTQESILISMQRGSVAFNDSVTISNRGNQGISIQNSSGGIAFAGAVDINNEQSVLTPAVDIQNSESNIVFSSLGILDAMGNAGGGAGVNLVGNLAGGTSAALHTYKTVNISTVDGVGFFANNNNKIRILDGMIVSDGAAAVDLEESIWSVSLGSVSSADSPDYGIRLVNAAPPADSSFAVNEELSVPAAGTGGIIEGAAIAAAQLENAGQVRLRGMQFDGNAQGIVLTNSGLAEDDDQTLELVDSAFLNTSGQAISAQNLSTLLVEDSLFDGGGTNLLTYNERINDPDTTTVGQFDNPYEVFWRRNVMDSTVTVQGLAGASDAHLNVEYTNNLVTLDETAVAVDWTGPSRVLLSSNAVTLNGGEDALDVVHRSTTDEMLLSILSNQLVATDVNSAGVNVETFGPSDILVDSNEFTFAGLDSTGMKFNLAPDTEFFLSNNQLRFDADGGAGVIFSRVNQPSVFTINNNQVGLFDDGPLIEEGLRFLTAIGSPVLVGTVDNQIFLLESDDPAPAPAFIEIPFSFGGTFNGQIIINGGLQP